MFAYQEKLEKLCSAITSGKSGVGDIIIFATHSKQKENVEVGEGKNPTLFLKHLVVVAIIKDVKVRRGIFFTSRLISCNGGKVLSGNAVKAEKSVRLSKYHGRGWVGGIPEVP